MLKGWVGAAELRSMGPWIVGVGLLMLPILAFVHAHLVPLALFSSGFGLLGPFYVVRHMFRHSDDPQRATDRAEAKDAAGGRTR